MSSHLNWHCTAIGADEQAEAVVSEDGVLSLFFVGLSVHIVMHTSSARTASETHWMLDVLASRLVGLLTLPASCRGARCTVRHLASSLDTTVMMLVPRPHGGNDEPTLTESRIADLPSCSFVFLLCTRVDPHTSGGVAQVMLACSKGACTAVYTDASLRVHTDVLSSPLDTDDDGKWRNNLALIACSATGGAATIVLEAPQAPLHISRSGGLLSSSQTSVLSRSSAGTKVCVCVCVAWSILRA